MNKTIALNEGEEIHDLQINDLFLIQNKNGYCFTTESVLLANFIKLKPTQKAVEFCAGNGIISVLVASKNKYKEIIAVEMQPNLANLAERNFSLNKFKNIRVICDKVQNSANFLDAEYADVLYCNPPFFTTNIATAKNQERAMARAEIFLPLEDLIVACARTLKYGGNLYLVHSSERLAEVLTVLKRHNLEPKQLQLIQPKIDKESNSFLVMAKKGGKTGIKCLPTLIMYTKNGEETEQIKKIYQRKGCHS